MTPDEIAIRKPVWIAMSDLFLDTDVRLWYVSIARVLAESPYTLEELTDVFYKEVAPIVAPNLLVVAGEWAGFDEEWLLSRITARLERTLRMPSFLGSMASDDWEAVLVLVGTLRKLDASERPRRIALWERLSKLFFDSFAHEPMALDEGHTAAELEAVWRNEMWPAYGRSVKAYRNPTKEEIEQAFANLKNAVS